MFIKMHTTFSILWPLIYFLVDFKLMQCSLNCMLLNELSNVDSFNENLNEANYGMNMRINIINDTNSGNYSYLNISGNSNVTIAPLSAWEMDPLFSKCGILPANLMNNKKSNSKFFIHWLFNSHKSFKLSFRLEFVENYTLLSYYFSIRKFTTNEEFLTKIRSFTEINETKMEDEDENEASIEESLEFKNTIEKNLLISYLMERSYPSNPNMTNSSRHEAFNNLIVNFKPNHMHHASKYEMLNQMYVICVMIINLKSGVTFTLPYMCLDVFIDRRYYKSIKMSNNTLSSFREHSLGIMLSLGPLTIVAFIVVAFLHYYKAKHKLLELPNEMDISQEYREYMNRVILNQFGKKESKNEFRNSSIDQIEETILANGALTEEAEEKEDYSRNNEEKSSNIIQGTENNEELSEIEGTEYSNERRYSRYELIEDQEPMSCHEEVLIHDLIQNIEKKSTCSSSLNFEYVELKSKRSTNATNSTRNSTINTLDLNANSLMATDYFYLNENYLNSKKLNDLNINL